MENSSTVDKRQKAPETKVISTRITIDLFNRLRKKHPNSGDTQKLLKALLEKYLDGRVLGISL